MITTAIQVDLLGRECNTDAADEDGAVWSVAQVDGWDAPDQRTTFQAPTDQHGSVGLGFFAHGRGLVVTGSVEAVTQDGAWAAFNRAASSMPGLLGEGEVVIDEPTPKTLTVRQSGPPRINPPLNGVFTFQLTLLAEYPWKRAVDPVTVTIAAGTSETFDHDGTFPAEFTATTTSSGTVGLSCAGLTLSAGSVASGTVLDSLEHTITGSGGADLYGSIVAGSEWPAVVVGSNTWTNSGTADVELTFYPTYA